MRYSDKKFTSNFITTIGIDYKRKVVDVKNRNAEPPTEKPFTLLIWDTAGQERFKTITTSYFRGCQGILLVYSVTDRKSFKNVNVWMDEITRSGETHVNKILLANKCDLEADRVVSTKEGQELAASYGIPFFETSAKNNVNISEAFMTIAEDVVVRLGDQLGKPKSKGGKKVDLSKGSKGDGGDLAQKKGCC